MGEKKRKVRGTVLVLMASGLVALMGALAMSIDVGYFYVVRNQLQNAVDAAALAGAGGLMSQPGNYTASGAAVTWAKDYASRNKADGKSVDLATSEITFPKSNVIKIDAARPVKTFFAAIFGVKQVNIRARAAATAAPVIGGSGGWRPFAPPDQFAHGFQCVTPMDSSHGPYQATVHTWNGITDRDYYQSPYDSSFTNMDVSSYMTCSGGSPTGFITPRDVNGRRLQLKVDQTFSPGNFFPLALGGPGGSTYQTNIQNGWSGTINVGDMLTTETGNMVGPTRSGLQNLVALDPNAQMRTDSSGKYYVWSDRYPINESPRIVPIPLFDPTDPPGNGRTTFRVANIGAFFVDNASGGGVVFGYFIHMRLPQANVTQAPSSTPSNSSGGGGRLLGSIQMVDPDKY
jgi:hypothetical protein